MSDARTTVLDRIQKSLGTPASAQQIAASYAGLSRDYIQTGTDNQDKLLHLLEDRLRDYDAGVFRCQSHEVAATSARILSERGKRRIAIPAGMPADWLPGDVELVQDSRQGISEIDSCDGVLTTATVAIAATGTIILQDSFDTDGGGQGRRALTLLPDYQLCLLEAKRVVETVPEAMTILQPTATLATTFFSGPSATADIEMTRIKGVHGPRFVDVILILQ